MFANLSLFMEARKNVLFPYISGNPLTSTFTNGVISDDISTSTLFAMIKQFGDRIKVF